MASSFFDRLLGFRLPEKSNNEVDVESKNSFQLPEITRNDGAIEIDSGNFLQFGTSFDYQVPEDEVQLITKYRDLAREPEFTRAIDEIANEFFAYDDDSMPVNINVDDLKVSANIKKKIQEEFDNILHMLNFKTDAYEIFTRWYIDGRLYYHKVVDESNKKKGILQLKYIDPRKIRKVRKEIKTNNSKTITKNSINNNVRLNVKYEEFYVYNPAGINNANVQGVPITKDSITYIHSGAFTRENKTVVSLLHKSIRFFNMLRNIEDSIVIYRLSRAAEKRVFNIELGDLPPNQAKQHMKEVIDKFRKRLSYNPQTGEIIEQKKFMTMLEDFWFAKRDGKGTTVDFLQGGQNLGELEDVDYFKRKFYESLSVPITRLDPTVGFTLGRASEISRDELKFTKYVSRLRKRFSFLFEDMLKTQLILKNILKETEWNEIAKDLSFDYLSDNYFTELKETEIYQNRFNAARDTGIEGKLVSKLWVQKNLLRLTDEEIKEENDQIKKEMEEEMEMGGMAQQGDEQDQGDNGSDEEPQIPQIPKKPSPSEDDTIDESYSMLKEYRNSKKFETILNEVFQDEDRFEKLIKAVVKN